MMITLIRHAQKIYGNKSSESCKYDSPLISGADKHICQKYNAYVNKLESVPTKIICSPYLRTRETAEVISNLSGVPYEIHKDASEYLGWNSDINDQDFYPETLEYGPFVIESMDEFQDRVKFFLHELLNMLNDGDHIWVITHGLIISTILKEYGIVKDNIKTLKGISITKDKVIIL